MITFYRLASLMETLIVFSHRYLDRNKLAKVPPDAFSNLANLKYL